MGLRPMARRERPARAPGESGSPGKSGVHGFNNDPAGDGVYGENVPSGNFGYLGSKEQGVHGFGAVEGAHAVTGEHSRPTATAIYGVNSATGVHGAIGARRRGAGIRTDRPCPLWALCLGPGGVRQPVGQAHREGDRGHEGGLLQTGATVRAVVSGPMPAWAPGTWVQAVPSSDLPLEPRLWRAQRVAVGSRERNRGWSGGSRAAHTTARGKRRHAAQTRPPGPPKATG